ncbi:unnamed protein product [Pleuronectes platessa]|uniref:Uncharacterized protein n=1 Tax=Pleuronectes platessa TaxID=8262 RepID=A0A9N7U3B7_PLEPL|nr:unnamed protein product [Pleuronectes platessa]
MECPASPRRLEAMEELHDVILTLNEMMYENCTPKELMDKKPRQRELVDEYSALKEPEAHVIFLLRELIAQFTALKELVDVNPNPDYSALMELDGEYSTLKEQTATNNPTWETEGKMVEQMECSASPRRLEAMEELHDIILTLNEMMDENCTPKELMDKNPRQRELVDEYSAVKEQTTTNNLTWETERKMVEQMQSPASLLMKCHVDLIPLTQHVESAKAKEKELEKELGEMNMEEELSREEQPEFRVLLNGASQSEEKSSNEQELSLKRESKQEDEIRPLIQQNIWLQEVPLENDKQSMMKEKKKQEKEKKKQEKKKMEKKERKKIEKEKKEIEKKEKQETEKMERKERKKIDKEKNEREGTTTGKWYIFCLKCFI